MSFKTLEQAIEGSGYVSSRDIQQHLNRFVAWWLIFMMKRDSDWEYVYTWLEESADGNKSRMFADYWFEVPKQYRKNCELRFTGRDDT